MRLAGEGQLMFSKPVKHIGLCWRCGKEAASSVLEACCPMVPPALPRGGWSLESTFDARGLTVCSGRDLGLRLLRMLTSPISQVASSVAPHPA